MAGKRVAVTLIPDHGGAFGPAVFPIKDDAGVIPKGTLRLVWHEPHDAEVFARDILVAVEDARNATVLP